MEMINAITAIILSEKELKIWLVLFSSLGTSQVKWDFQKRRTNTMVIKIRFFPVTVLSSLNWNKTTQDKTLTYFLLIYDVLVTILRTFYSSPHLVPNKIPKIRIPLFSSYDVKNENDFYRVTQINDFYRVTQIINKRDMFSIQAV